MIFCIRYLRIFLIYYRHVTLTNNSQIEVYVDKVGNRSTFKIKIVLNFFNT